MELDPDLMVKQHVTELEGLLELVPVVALASERAGSLLGLFLAPDPGPSRTRGVVSQLFLVLLAGAGVLRGFLLLPLSGT